MADLIDREALSTALCELARRNPVMTVGIHMARKMVTDAPTIAAAPVVHARWVDPDGDGIVWCCSACNHPDDWRTPYCAHCGARMDADAPARAGKEREGG